MIQDPVTLKAGARVGEALHVMRSHKIGGIPIIDDDGKLIGILTNRDLRFETDMDRSVDSIMTKENLVTAPNGTTLELAREILQKHKIEKLPVVTDDLKLVGLITFRDLMKLEDYPNSCKDEHGRLIVGAAVGIGADTFERVEALRSKQVDVICVDTAHGHSIYVLNMIKELKAAYPDLQIIGGNIATGEAALALVEAGADGVKVGVGPGSICTTRIVAGVGVPQLSAIQNAAIALRGTGVPVIGDGGIRYTGDIG
jgi:IMP dehydrogenase